MPEIFVFQTGGEGAFTAAAGDTAKDARNMVRHPHFAPISSGFGGDRRDDQPAQSEKRKASEQVPN